MKVHRAIEQHWQKCDHKNCMVCAHIVINAGRAARRRSAAIHSSCWVGAGLLALVFLAWIAR